MNIFFLLVTILLAHQTYFRVACAVENIDSVRPKAVDCSGEEFVIWFSTEKIFWKYSHDKFASWVQLSFPSEIKAFSHPAAACLSNDTGILFVQTQTGQVYNTIFTQGDTTITVGKWKLLGEKIPYDEGVIPKSHDGISVEKIGGDVYVFARSFTNSSRLYSMKMNGTESTTWLKICGDDISLKTDQVVAYNSFTNLLEAFMVGTDHYLYRCWQLNSDNEWSSWDKTGYSAPLSDHAPVVHAMDTNAFNGRLNVFVHSQENKLHHIWQTTCDHVPNPWGWCTWSLWYTIGDSIPLLTEDVVNTLTVGRNLHHGIEVFVVSAKGILYKLWQLDRHKEWSNWEQVYSNNEYRISSLPTVSNKMLWWTVYALDSNKTLVSVTQNHTFGLNPSNIGFSEISVASWQVPIDEASNKDWIAIYPSGSANNEDYLDYSYVGGSQNPLSQPVPSGHVAFNVYLPKGAYSVRYLIDKQFVSAAETELTVTSSSSEEEWVQIFRGIFIGLNIHNVSVDQCVKDAKDIPAKFDEAFKHFADRDIYTGIQKLGVALSSVIKGMIDCGIEEAFVDRIKVFVSDLIACAKEGSCARFVIDIGKEVLVLYENIYEIYSDIRASSNCFKIKAYAQGAYNIGRVIGACIALPR